MRRDESTLPPEEFRLLRAQVRFRPWIGIPHRQREKVPPSRGSGRLHEERFEFPKLGSVKNKIGVVGTRPFLVKQTRPSWKTHTQTKIHGLIR